LWPVGADEHGWAPWGGGLAVRLPSQVTSPFRDALAAAMGSDLSVDAVTPQVPVRVNPPPDPTARPPRRRLVKRLRRKGPSLSLSLSLLLEALGALADAEALRGRALGAGGPPTEPSAAGASGGRKRAGLPLWPRPAGFAAHGTPGVPAGTSPLTVPSTPRASAAEGAAASMSVSLHAAAAFVTDSAQRLVDPFRPRGSQRRAPSPSPSPAVPPVRGHTRSSSAVLQPAMLVDPRTTVDAGSTAVPTAPSASGRTRMGLDASHEDLDHVATWEQMGSERPPDGIASDGDDDDGAGGGPQDDDDASASEDDVERSEGEEADEHGEAVGGDGPQGSLGGAHNDDGLGMGRSASMLHSPALPPLPASSLAEDAPARRRSQTELAPVPPPSANAAASLPLVRGLGPIQRGERGHTVTRVHLCFRRMHC
jgi:hypothetical protein